MASSTQDTQKIDVGTEIAAPATESESGLDENVAGALSYAFGLISGLVFYLVEKENDFVRFHAAQSMAFSGLLIGAYVGLTFFSTVATVVTWGGSTGGFLVGSLFSLVLGLVWLAVALGGFGAWVYLMVKAYRGETPRLPVAAKIADRLV